MQKELSPEFTHLVDWTVSTLGRVIQREAGKKSFDRIEKIRRYVKSKKGGSLQGLLSLKKDLARLSPDERFKIAHAFALMLELINACEAAYRIHRLMAELPAESSLKHTPGRIIHVLTAHPTESRNPSAVFYFKIIQELLVRHLESPEAIHEEELFKNISIVWKTPLSKQRKPSVMDEAQYIYSMALHEDIIDLYVRQRRENMPFYIRTWVGGDKDGHPGVDETTMLGSLELSRASISAWLMKCFDEIILELTPISGSSLEGRERIAALVSDTRKLKALLRDLKKIRVNDSKRVHGFKERCQALEKSFIKNFGSSSEQISSITEALKVFPGLVVPLELREDSALVHEALEASTQKYNISRMMNLLGQLSPTHDPRFYVRGFVLSQTESAKDIMAGTKLVEKYVGKAKLPVVPLFESSHSLKNSVSIVEEFLKEKKTQDMVRKRWGGQFEVMLGYSDSMKENGSFPSRYLIYSAISNLETVIKRKKITPIFFHGSGGSVERGGGSIQEQTAWWPASALATVKMTIQGEVIYRNYTSRELLLRHLDLLAEARDARNAKPSPVQKRGTHKALVGLADFVQNQYQTILKDPDFLQLIEHATPYSFLKDVRLGSRPSKRQGAVQIKNLRAIPWVLCWTQTRAHFPSWWGVGRYWQTLSAGEKRNLKKSLQESAVFGSYVKVLGFTLAKIELDVFSMYLHGSKLDRNVVEKFDRLFREEYKLCLKFVHEITGKQSLLWYRPWLETSIALRSPLIHPLNILQMVALDTKDVRLLRETVSGVASGMLTTG
ncbi:MAG TPA: phosphoenolpyruvate carboxylase [Bdellovibrio sp.]|uniref:phosphoenolpyruvate carboxylase n=1 Tax=Bdellovibrio sp. TaxID=28201 RepID=UPI002F229375